MTMDDVSITNGVSTTPEMLVEGNAVEIVDGDVTPGLPDFTNFGTVNVAAGTVTRTYTIKNTGGSNLNLTGVTPFVIIGGVNAADFALTGDPITPIAAAGQTTFQITFNPSAVGIRAANITIANNDSNENPYNFDISGNGSACVPTVAVTSITPTSGPTATEVTINGSGFASASTVSFGGTIAVFTIVSATVIKATVPSGAVSGNITITDSAGCDLAFSSFTVISTVNTGCDGASLFTDLIISEVYDSNALNVWHMELYNPTQNPINLATSNYILKRYGNIGDVSPTRIITLSGIVNPGGVYYAQLGNSGVPCGGSYNFTELGNGINALDEIRLTKNGVDVDVVQCPNEVGYTIKRNLTAAGPTMTYAAVDWTFNSNEVCIDLGLPYLAIAAPPTTTLPNVAIACNNNSTQITVIGTQGVAGGQALTYQWYSSAIGDAAWTTLTNTGIYFGVTTNVLTIVNVATITGIQYYCQVRESGTTCFRASNATTVNVTSAFTEWTGTWSNSAPTLSKYALLKSNYNTAINGNIDACTVKVQSGTLTISSENYVNIQFHLVVEPGAFVSILDKGSLVQIDNNGVNTGLGTVNVSRTTTPYERFDYTYWSSPIANQTFGTCTLNTWRMDRAFLFNTANFQDLFGGAGYPQTIPGSDSYDDTGDAWQNVGVTTPMLPGKGYIVMAPTTGAFPTTSSVTFTGGTNSLTTGNVIIPLALSQNIADNNDDFNLVGNPYPSAIRANDFINANLPNITGTLYFWTHKNDISIANPGPGLYNFSEDDYAYYNLTGGTATTGTVGTGSNSGSIAPNGFIASGQGFLVEAQNNTTSLVFNNLMRNKTHVNTSFFRLQNSLSDRIWLNLTNPDGLFSQQLIGYFETTSTGFDLGYDGLVTDAKSYINFYSVANLEPYKIQSRGAFSESDIVPLGYNTAANGLFTISIDNKEGVLNDVSTQIYLKDNELNIYHNLKAAPYDFTTVYGTYNSRFEIHYTNPTLGNSVNDLQNNAISVVSANDKTIIKSEGLRIDKVLVYDMLGRALFTKNEINSREFSITNMQWSKQTLIVKVILENGEVVTKKIIN